MDELSIQDAVNTLGERLRKVPKRYAGAQFRFAFMRDAPIPFLTGSVAFCPEPVASRPTF